MTPTKAGVPQSLYYLTLPPMLFFFLSFSLYFYSRFPKNTSQLLPPMFLPTHRLTHPPTQPLTSLLPSIPLPPSPQILNEKKKLKARSIKAFIKLKFPFSNFRTRLAIKFTEAMFLRGEVWVPLILLSADVRLPDLTVR